LKVWASTGEQHFLTHEHAFQTLELMKGAAGLFLLAFLVSCETNMTDDDWPEHETKLVIVAALRLQNDSVYVYCRVSRTMGLGEKFNLEDAMVYDAEVKLVNDGATHDIPHRRDHYPFAGAVNYFAVIPRRVTDAYTLTVRKGKLSARSALTCSGVPLNFDSMMVNRMSQKFGALVEVKFVLATPTHRMHYGIQVEHQLVDGSWTALSRGPSGTYLYSRTNPTAASFVYYSDIDNGKERCTISARSPEYSFFRDSRHNDNYSGSPFEPEGKNPPFNITGDGIGFFWYELVGEPVEIPY
jgi:hypothetical protein